MTEGYCDIVVLRPLKAVGVAFRCFMTEWAVSTSGVTEQSACYAPARSRLGQCGSVEHTMRKHLTFLCLNELYLELKLILELESVIR